MHNKQKLVGKDLDCSHPSPLFLAPVLGDIRLGADNNFVNSENSVAASDGKLGIFAGVVEACNIRTVYHALPLTF